MNPEAGVAVLTARTVATSATGNRFRNDGWLEAVSIADGPVFRRMRRGGVCYPIRFDPRASPRS